MSLEKENRNKRLGFGRVSVLTFERHKDHDERIEDIHNSPDFEGILVSWLRKKDNYKRWKKDDPQDKTKDALCTEIKELMEECAILLCQKQAIYAKIQHIQQNFLESQILHRLQFRRIEEGMKRHGVPNELVENTIMELMMKVFPFYYDLVPVMGVNLQTDPVLISSSTVKTYPWGPPIPWKKAGLRNIDNSERTNVVEYIKESDMLYQKKAEGEGKPKLLNVDSSEADRPRKGVRDRDIMMDISGLVRDFDQEEMSLMYISILVNYPTLFINKSTLGLNKLEVYLDSVAYEY
ncbi:hypothetical protein J3Q64DRAFT_1820237 [Phycomyces blakesleeanus]|uniref:Uncharacterized protein n=1 Tax=Phycomyces blakesleeanus TaxID=4837 RepID=A0ABR3B6D5_PHYBL